MCGFFLFFLVYNNVRSGLDLQRDFQRERERERKKKKLCHFFCLASTAARAFLAAAAVQLSSSTLTSPPGRASIRTKVEGAGPWSLSLSPPPLRPAVEAAAAEAGVRGAKGDRGGGVGEGGADGDFSFFLLQRESSAASASAAAEDTSFIRPEEPTEEDRNRTTPSPAVSPEEPSRSGAMAARTAAPPLCALTLRPFEPRRRCSESIPPPLSTSASPSRPSMEREPPRERTRATGGEQIEEEESEEEPLFPSSLSVAPRGVSPPSCKSPPPLSRSRLSP